MRKLLWMILLFCVYVWVITSGHDGFVLEQGKALYKAFISWFDDAQLDFHLKSKPLEKKKSRRWD